MDYDAPTAYNVPALSNDPDHACFEFSNPRRPATAWMVHLHQPQGATVALFYTECGSRLMFTVRSSIVQISKPSVPPPIRSRIAIRINLQGLQLRRKHCRGPKVSTGSPATTLKTCRFDRNSNNKTVVNFC